MLSPPPKAGEITKFIHFWNCYKKESGEYSGFLYGLSSFYVKRKSVGETDNSYTLVIFEFFQKLSQIILFGSCRCFKMQGLHENIRQACAPVLSGKEAGVHVFYHRQNIGNVRRQPNIGNVQIA